MGILLSQHGVGPTEEKVWAVKEASHPITPSEVRNFLGLVRFSSRFIPDFATIAEPLRALTRNGVKFEWTEVQDKAFQTLKEQLAEVPIAYCRCQPGRIWRCSSSGGEWAEQHCELCRSLSDVEQRYSQTEKKALALVWACERFNLYLNGLPEFHLVADHQALKTIFGPRSKPSARIKHWVLRLQSLNYRVCFVSSRNNIADALSRLTKILASQGYIQDEEYVREVTLQAVPVALRIEEIEEASKQDDDLRVVHACLQSGD